MKKRLIPALSIGIVVLLIGSLAYAADKKKSAKSLDRNTDTTHEEEALTAELLNAVEEKDLRLQDSGETVQVDIDGLNDIKGPLASTKRP